MKFTYYPWLVGLSVVLAILVSFTSLGLAARVAESKESASRTWLVLGSVSMGAGIWSMHFIGMLAFSVPIQLRYDIGLTLVSLAVAIFTSGFAIKIASSSRLSLRRHIVCSLIMGLGIVSMHYVGMAAIPIVPGISYDPMLVAASISIAILASFAALWLTFNLRSSARRSAWIPRMAAAVVMGIAIAGMHYTAMAASRFPLGAFCRGGVSLDNQWLGVSVAIAAFGLLSITLVISVFDAHLEASARLHLEGLERADSRLLYQATHDTLTGLPNRTLFLERLEQAVARVKRGDQAFLAVLFLDFDRFKLVNDTLGHEAGDELLRQISLRLKHQLRATDVLSDSESGNVVSRFGGDEFLLLINDLKIPAAATRMAERLLNALSPSYDILGSEVHTSASIGIVTSEQCCTNAEDIVRNADVAMYEAKRAGRACSVVFNEAMHTQLTRHVTIETSLRRAIGSAEIHLVYQPIIELASGQMVSAEALVRWEHPTLGAISPSEFIPIAEESGLIVGLDEWVRQEACQAMVKWRQSDPQHAPKTVSVNVSRAELALGRKLIDQVRATLERTGLPAHCLQIEVTESEVMHNPDAALRWMKELKALGVKLAMDDFGTGSSSLGILRKYPFDTIKIDRSFVQGLTDGTSVLAVIHATINLVENLGMGSLVEGIEEAAQVAILQSLGCRYGQGYYLCRPVPANQLIGAVRMRETGSRAGRSISDVARATVA